MITSLILLLIEYNKLYVTCVLISCLRFSSGRPGVFELGFNLGLIMTSSLKKVMKIFAWYSVSLGFGIKKTIAIVRHCDHIGTRGHIERLS